MSMPTYPYPAHLAKCKRPSHVRLFLWEGAFRDRRLREILGMVDEGERTSWILLCWRGEGAGLGPYERRLKF